MHMTAMARLPSKSTRVPGCKLTMAIWPGQQSATHQDNKQPCRDSVICMARISVKRCQVYIWHLEGKMANIEDRY